MKVLCVRKHKLAKGITTGKNFDPNSIPSCEIGSIYTVLRRVKSGFFAGYCYELAELNVFNGMKVLYDERSFATLDGPCEMELHEQHVEKLTAEYVAKYGEPPIVELDPVRFAKIWENVSREMDKKDSI